MSAIWFDRRGYTIRGNVETGTLHDVLRLVLELEKVKDIA